jgi:hypothetical protein
LGTGVGGEDSKGGGFTWAGRPKPLPALTLGGAQAF